MYGPRRAGSARLSNEIHRRLSFNSRADLPGSSSRAHGSYAVDLYPPESASQPWSQFPLEPCFGRLRAPSGACTASIAQRKSEGEAGDAIAFHYQAMASSDGLYYS